MAPVLFPLRRRGSIFRPRSSSARPPRCCRKARAVPDLAAGATSAGSTTIVVPLTVATGTYYLIAEADGADAVQETRENNNTSSRNHQDRRRPRRLWTHRACHRRSRFPPSRSAKQPRTQARVQSRPRQPASTFRPTPRWMPRIRPCQVAAPLPAWPRAPPVLVRRL